MNYAVRVGGNSDLIQLCINKAKKLNLQPRTIHQSEWFWANQKFGTYGVQSINPDMEYNFVHISDFLALEIDIVVKLGCSEVVLKEDRLFFGDKSIERNSRKLKDLESVFSNGKLECDIFGHRIVAEPGALYIDGSSIRVEDVYRIIGWIQK